jgi:hypothetical protein
MDAMQGYADMITHGPLFEYPSANGNDPFALVRLMQVRLSFCKGVLWGRYYEIDDPDSPVLKLLNVRYVLASHKLDKPGGLVKALEFPATYVYENSGVLPRFFLVSRVHRAANMDAALMRLRARDFDPRTEAVVEAPVEMEGNAPSADVHVREYSARGFTVETEASVPAFLVTSETAYPGWNAWVDGEARTPVMTNAAFRGLPVPAGRHVVRMRFDPAILSRSAWVTLAAGVMLALAVWFGDNRQQKGPWTLKSS